MFCKNCGNQINGEARFCTNCGKQIIINDANNNASDCLKNLNVDLGSSKNYWLGAFIPVLALFWGFKWKKNKPISSKQLLVGSLIFILEIIYIIGSILIKNQIVNFILLIGAIYLVYWMIKNINKQKNILVSNFVQKNDLNKETVMHKVKKMEKNNKYMIFATISLIIALVMLLMPFIAGIMFVVILIVFTMGSVMFNKENLIKDTFNVAVEQLFPTTSIISLVFFTLSIILFVIYFKKRKQISNEKFK